MTLVPHELPNYVELGGRQVWRPPYDAGNAEIFGFVLGADRTAIDAVLHEALVEPTKGAVDYRCAHDNIVITFATIDRLASENPPDSLCGYLPEKEVSVWCLAADTVTNRLVWYLPYVFTDSGQTVITGREVYGYPKQIGEFPKGYPEKLLAGGDTTVEALAIHPFGEDQPAEARPMISVERGPAQEGAAETVPSASSAEEFVIAFPHEEIAAHAGRPVGPRPKTSATITSVNAPRPASTTSSAPWMGRFFDSIRGRSLSGHTFDLVVDMVTNPTLVFLKQFRDVLCPTKACYQAIVEAPLGIHLLSADYDALDPELFKITVEDWDSHPIASDVGVPGSTPITPKRAFRARLDFEIALGEEVWRAPT